MDRAFTEKVQHWLDEPQAHRDYMEGAVLLLQLSNNKIMYANIAADPAAHADIIEYNIRKYMKFRLAEITHEQVRSMERKVKKIVERPAAFKQGIREDHDDLPPEVQALYVENADIMRRMRELHLKLRTINTANATCPDSERYPFLKELIRLDKLYHSNWRRYDNYNPSNAAEEAEQILIDEQREREKVIRQQLTMSRGRYKKNPTEGMKAKIERLEMQLAELIGERKA